MDRRLILAVAGSGKTNQLINLLDKEKRFLIVTYTNNNVANIRRRIIESFGYLPNNITLMSYYQFLIRVCYRPFLRDEIRAKGIMWKMPDMKTLKIERDNLNFYLTPNKYLYHNRISKLCMDRCANLIKERIERFYDNFMIDEVQDLGGYDFNLMLSIIPSTINCLFVGDFYQHTFDTSKDGNINKNLYMDYDKYKAIWSKVGITIDETTLSKSYRCSPTICQFINENLNIPIFSNKPDKTEIILVDNQTDADKLFSDAAKIKLFYKEANKYFCSADNWGKSKGLDNFMDICIVLNKNVFDAYKNKALHKLAKATLNKFYVACTRAKGNIYFIPHTFIDKYKQSTLT